MELKNRMLVTAMGEANIPAAEIIEGAMRGAARAVLGPDAIPPL
jgi:acetyl-CoA carboxylase carboxyltransferase component